VVENKVPESLTILADLFLHKAKVISNVDSRLFRSTKKNIYIRNSCLVRLDGYVAVMGDTTIAYRNFVGKYIR